MGLSKSPAFKNLCQKTISKHTNGLKEHNFNGTVQNMHIFNVSLFFQSNKVSIKQW